MRQIKIFKNNLNKMLKSSAFTLAEVLITLMIIGIIASITIPILMQNFQTQQTIQRLNKAYSALSQAARLAIVDNGPVSTWNLFSGSTAANSRFLFDTLTPYFHIVKSCRTPLSMTDCTVSSYTTLDNNTDSGFISDNSFPRFITNNGMTIILMAATGTACLDYGNASAPQSLHNVCAEMYVDINGLASPNTYGKDFFVFYLNGDGAVIPSGLAGDKMYSFNGNCKTSGGFGCTGWVLTNNNMDYTKCGSSLSWANQRTCP